MKRACLLYCLCVFSTTIYGEATDYCAQLAGTALSQCRSDQQALHQQQLEQQLQQQEQRQNQLDQQQRDVQQQLESMRLQNEDLRRRLREIVSPPQQPGATDSAKSAENSAEKSAEVKIWYAENPWFGSDYSKTSFAMHYAKQLQQERPDLTHRALLDAITAKVNETFSERH